MRSTQIIGVNVAQEIVTTFLGATFSTDPVFRRRVAKLHGTPNAVSHYIDGLEDDRDLFLTENTVAIIPSTVMATTKLFIPNIASICSSHVVSLSIYCIPNAREVLTTSGWTRLAKAAIQFDELQDLFGGECAIVEFDLVDLAGECKRAVE